MIRASREFPDYAYAFGFHAQSRPDIHRSYEEGVRRRMAESQKVDGLLKGKSETLLGFDL
jgi:hypothetical protein